MALTTVAHVIFPIVVIAGLGFGLARLGVFRPADIAGLARYVFSVAVPALLFHSLATLSLPPRVDWRFLAAYYLAAFAIYGLGMVVSRLRFAHSLREQGVFGLAAAYSNTLLIGLPVALGALGESVLLPMLLIISVHTGLMSLAVAAVAETGAGRRQAWRATARSVALNPITLSVAAGLAFNVLGLGLPGPVDDVLGLLASTVVPCALFMLGASLTQYRLAEYSREAWSLVGLKLLVHPLLAWLLVTYVFGLRGAAAAAAVITAGAPIGITVSVFAHKYQACIPAVATATLLSTVLAIVSLSVVLVLVV